MLMLHPMRVSVRQHLGAEVVEVQVQLVGLMQRPRPEARPLGRVGLLFVGTALVVHVDAGGVGVAAVVAIARAGLGGRFGC